MITTQTWYRVLKSQPCREQSTIGGLIAGWCGHVTRDTCVWCVTLRRRARQCEGRRSVYGSYKNWRWRSDDGISKSDWGYHSVQAQHGPSRHAGYVWWCCTQRRPQLRVYCEQNKLSGHLMMGCLLAKVFCKHCTTLSNIVNYFQHLLHAWPKQNIKWEHGYVELLLVSVKTEDDANLKFLFKSLHP